MLPLYGLIWSACTVGTAVATVVRRVVVVAVDLRYGPRGADPLPDEGVRRLDSREPSRHRQCCHQCGNVRRCGRCRRSLGPPAPLVGLAAHLAALRPGGSGVGRRLLDHLPRPPRAASLGEPGRARTDPRARVPDPIRLIEDCPAGPVEPAPSRGEADTTDPSQSSRRLWEPSLPLAHCPGPLPRITATHSSRSWFASYLERAHGIQVASASALTMLPLAGYIAGSIDGRTAHRRVVPAHGQQAVEPERGGSRFPGPDRLGDLDGDLRNLSRGPGRAGHRHHLRWICRAGHLGSHHGRRRQVLHLGHGHTQYVGKPGCVSLPTSPSAGSSMPSPSAGTWCFSCWRSSTSSGDCAGCRLIPAEVRVGRPAEHARNSRSEVTLP